MNLTVKEAMQACLDGKIVECYDGSMTSFVKFNGQNFVSALFVDDKTYSSVFIWSKADTIQIYEEPKPKRRYYQWRIKLDSGWCRPTPYMDEDGLKTDQTHFYNKSYWAGVEKEKVNPETDFVEV